MKEKSVITIPRLKKIDSHNLTHEEALTALESGQILLMPTRGFDLRNHEMIFLSPSSADKKSKNVSFNPTTGLVRGTPHTGEHYEQLKVMLKRFASSAHELIQQLFPTYTHHLQLGRTSFRPVEIKGRVTSYRKDDTRLHVDAFPATPNQGKRILRVFTNINPNGQARVWRCGEPFEEVAKQFLPRVSHYSRWLAKLLRLSYLTKSYRTAYDHMMLHIHNHMKADLHYQKTASQEEIHFMPGDTWIVQTDHVSHAAMSGQHLLEQTFYLPVSAMQNPGLSPLRVLEKLTGKKLT